MTYHIYDKIRKRFMASIVAGSTHQEMAITDYWMADTLKTKEAIGYRLAF